MKIDPAFVPFAVTLAAGVLAPDSLGHRGLVTFAANSVAYAGGLATSEAPMFAMSVTGTKSLTEAQEKQLNIAMTGVAMGAVTAGVVALVRRAPVSRVVIAAGLGAGFLLLDVRRAAKAKQLKEKGEAARAAAGEARVPDAS